MDFEEVLCQAFGIKVIGDIPLTLKFGQFWEAHNFVDGMKILE